MFNTIGDILASLGQPLTIWIFAYLCVGVLTAATLLWAVRGDQSRAATTGYALLGLTLWPVVAAMFVVALAFCLYPHKDAFDCESDLNFATRLSPSRPVRPAVARIGEPKLAR